MHDDVGAMLDRADQIGRGERVVDDERHAGLFGDRRDRLEVGDDAAGIGDELDEDRLGLRRDRGVEAEPASVASAQRTFQPNFAKDVVELVDRAAIELARGDELVARLQQRVEGEHLRRVARGDGKRRRAAFERRDALLQHRLGRVHDARIDVAEGLEIEQSRRVLGIVEDIGRGLIDRRGARAGRGVGLGAGMDGERVEAGLPVSGHVLALLAVGVVDGDDLVCRTDVGRARIAEFLEPDVAAAVADHQPLIVLQIVVGVLRQDRGLDARRP